MDEENSKVFLSLISFIDLFLNQTLGDQTEIRCKCIYVYKMQSLQELARNNTELLTHTAGRHLLGNMQRDKNLISARIRSENSLAVSAVGAIRI